MFGSRGMIMRAAAVVVLCGLAASHPLDVAEQRLERDARELLRPGGAALEEEIYGVEVPGAIELACVGVKRLIPTKIQVGSGYVDRVATCEAEFELQVKGTVAGTRANAFKNRKGFPGGNIDHAQEAFEDLCVGMAQAGLMQSTGAYNKALESMKDEKLVFDYMTYDYHPCVYTEGDGQTPGTCTVSPSFDYCNRDDAMKDSLASPFGTESPTYFADLVEEGVPAPKCDAGNGFRCRGDAVYATLDSGKQSKTTLECPTIGLTKCTPQYADYNGVPQFTKEGARIIQECGMKRQKRKLCCQC